MTLALVRSGRPTRLTPEVQQKLIQAIATGNTRRTAAAYAGVSITTLEEWLARGKGTAPRAQTKIYADFADAVEKAEADAVATSVALIRQASQRNWTAAAWWLERRYPQEWGRVDALQGKGGLVREVIIREYEGVPQDWIG